MITLDVNADLGEGGKADAELFGVVTSANIACGGHAGNDAMMAASLARAKAHGVAAGAHPGFPDKASMGRAVQTTDAAEVQRLVMAQVATLIRHAQAAAVPLTHVKAHGALYHLVAHDDVLAVAFVDAVAACGRFAIVGPAAAAPIGTAAAPCALERRARLAGLLYWPEAFVDRGYLDDGRLVPRGHPGALLRHDPGEAGARAIRLALEQKLQAASGSWMHMEAATLCVHGDSPGALAAACEVREALTGAGVHIAAPQSGR